MNTISKQIGQCYNKHECKEQVYTLLNAKNKLVCLRSILNKYIFL